MTLKLRIACLILTLHALSALCATAQPTYKAEAVWRQRVGAFDVTLQTEPFNDGRQAHYVLRITPPGAAKGQDILLDGVLGELHSVTAWNNRRVTVLTAQAAAIVDVPSRALVDVFFCDAPAMSPGGRFIAFVQVTPRGADDGTAVLRVYDVSKEESDNRYYPMRSDDIGRMLTAGIIVFPDAQRISRRSKRIEGMKSHGVASPLTWIDADTFVFLDFEGGWDDFESSLAVVAVGVRPSVRDPDIRLQRLDIASFVDSTKLGDADSDVKISPGSIVSASQIIVKERHSRGFLLTVQLKESAALLRRAIDVDFPN